MEPEKDNDTEIEDEEEFMNKVKNLIRNRKFDDEDVKKNKKYIINVVNELEVSEKSIDFLKSLFEHYKLKVLITFKPFYKKLKSSSPS